MKKIILLLAVVFTSFSFANNNVKAEEDLLFGTCTYTITRITSEGVTETTYQIETRTAEECQQAAESHLQY